MRRLPLRAAVVAAVLAWLAWLAPTARAQSPLPQFDKIMVSGRGFPEAGATITVCSSAGVLIQSRVTLQDGCSPKVTIYSDPLSGVTKTNPFLSDGLGNAVFYAAAGVYTYAVTGPTVSPSLHKLVLSGGGSPCSISAMGGLDIVPQTCAGEKTLQGLAGFNTQRNFTLLPATGQTQENFYSGPLLSSFTDPNSFAADWIGSYFHTVTSLNQTATNPEMIGGLLSYKEDSTPGADIIGVTGAAASTQTSGNSSEVFGADGFAQANTTNGHITDVVGVAGEADSSTTSAAGGHVHVIANFKAFGIGSSDPLSLNNAAGLYIENHGGVARQNFGWVMDGNCFGLGNGQCDFLDADTDNIHAAGKVGVGLFRPGFFLPTYTPGSAGSLAAGTYYYLIALRDASNQESRSTSGTSPVTVGASGSVAIAFTGLANTYSYNAYRSTSATMVPATRYTFFCPAASACSFTDTGAAGTSVPAGPIQGANQAFIADFGKSGKIENLVGVGNAANQGDAGGLKHKRLTTGTVTAGARADVTVTWTLPFVDANYTPICSVLDTSSAGAGLSVERLRAQSAAAITVQVLNQAGGDLTGTLNCQATHD